MGKQQTFNCRKERKNTMKDTSRQIVLDTVNFANPSRVPHQIWDVPWTYMTYPEQMKAIRERFPDDIVWCPRFLRAEAPTKGEQYEVGQYVDEWGCVFENRQKGIIGEVKDSLVCEEEWEDGDQIRTPVEFLDLDVDAINAYCHNTDQFVLAGSSVRPFERMQFFAGTEKVLMDLLLQPDGMLEVLKRTHELFCQELEAWAKTDVDGLFIQDDWGTQRNLLISPKLWVELFKPCYADYAAIAKKYGKKLFMHSDGYILDIIPHLIEIGVDALNSQIFCIGLEKLEQFRGKITFWGEIDRQYLLSRGTQEEVRQAVDKVRSLLWQSGGCIAQVDFGVGTKPENVIAALEAWEK